MAMFEGYKRIDGSRSNTALIKSGHASPAEEWLLDPRFLSDTKLTSVFKDGALFTYQYGGPGMDEVTIPKGRMVGVSTPVKDFVTKKFKTVITLPGMALNHNTIGMAPYNYAKDLLQQDRFGGNQPGIITQDYIIMPYIPSVSPTTPTDTTYAAGVDALLAEELALTVNNKMPWGCILGKLEVGDYVKSTCSGRLTKWVKGTDGAEDIVGQALGCDLNAEPWGWLKWMLWDESALAQDDKYINRSGVSNLPTDAGYPYDASYSLGNTVFQDVHSQALTDPTGIAGLQDGSGNFIGYGKNDTQYENMELAELPGTITDGTLMVINAKDYAGGNLTHLKEGVVVKVGADAATAVQVAATDYTVNYKTGAITLTLKAAMAGKKIFADYQAFHFGTSSYLDFKGVAGAFFILLKK
jgi:hypothetical protein